MSHVAVDLDQTRPATFESVAHHRDEGCERGRELVKAYEGKSLKKLAAAPVAALEGVSDGDAEHLKAAFDIVSVRDLGTNEHFL